MRPPLEAQLIDLADEVAYNTADLDDAYSAGMLTAAEDVAECVPRYAAIFEAVETQYPGATARERFNEGLRQLMDALVSGLIEGVAAAAEAAGVKNADDVRGLASRLAAFTPEAARDQPRTEAVPLRQGLYRARSQPGPRAFHAADRRIVPVLSRSPRSLAGGVSRAGRAGAAAPRDLRLYCGHDG